MSFVRHLILRCRKNDIINGQRQEIKNQRKRLQDQDKKIKNFEKFMSEHMARNVKADK